MITHSRPLTPLEHLYIHIIPCNIQLGIQVENPSVIPEYIKRIQNTSLALHLRADKDNLYRTNELAPVQKIPESIKTMQGAVEYSLLSCRPQQTFPLATIAHNSNMIVFHAIHSFCDGAMLMRIVQEIQHPTNPKMPDSLPVPILISFKDQLNGIPTISHDYRDPIITHLANKHPKVPDTKDVFQNIFEKFPIESLKIYQNGKISGLTEFMGASLVLASKAIGDVGDGYGLQGAMDLRPYLPVHRQKDLDIVDHVGNFIMSSPKPNTVNDICQDFRKCLKGAQTNKTWLNHMKWDIDHYCNDNGEVKEDFPYSGLGNYISNVGQVHIKKPIKDIMMRIDMEEPYEMIAIITYSVISERENSIRSHLNYGRNGTTRKYMQRLHDAYGFALQNVGREKTIKDAISMIKMFDRRNTK